MTMEQTWRAHEIEELRERLPRLLVGALAAALLGAGAVGMALWATNPPIHVPRGEVAAQVPAGLLVEAGRHAAGRS